jgi:Sugar (and other) transporter
MHSHCLHQVAGIILGMLSLGFIGDLIGRKWGSVTTASLMFVGGILLTAADGVTIKGLAAMYMVAQVRWFCNLFEICNLLIEICLFGTMV